jgi:hypothetical protein
MSQVLWAAAALACPIGMGAMMWMMMRGNHGTATADQSEVARLRAEVDQLKSEREREI